MTVATYRFQLNAGFRFDDLRAQVDYLRKLGVSTIYTSPILKARSGSTHGYDVVDPTTLNPELGSDEEFDRLVDAARREGLDLLVDIVPNHMATSTQNPWWTDVLRQGQDSPFASYFDVDWSSADVRDNLADKVLLPILGRPYGDVLEDQEIRIVYENGAFRIQYYERRLPLNFASYLRILEAIRERLLKTGEQDIDEALAPILQTLTNWGLDHTEFPDVEEIRALQRRIDSLVQKNERTRKALEDVLRVLNGRPGDPDSFDQLDTILDDQSYRLSFWRNAAEEINYRRFFDITDLISIRVSDPAVFDATHKLVLELVERGAITGLRLDHIDGLLDPAGYLEMLGDRLDRVAPEALVVSEKILGEHEEMPETFRYRGTTGYEVASSLDRALVSDEGFDTLDRAFAEISGLDSGFASVARESKMRVIRDLFKGELNNFTRRLASLTSGDRHAKDLPLSALEESLVQFIASLPVYRTYIRENEIQDRDRKILEQTVNDANSRIEEESVIAALEFLHRVLLLDNYDDSQRQEWLRFVMRFQQFTGPATAKGVEDTALYVYTPLASLNEVGSEPVLPPDSVAELHELNLRRLSITSRTLSATSTHDTKRGEDTRCRIDVLSEVPGEWLRNFSAWTSRYASIDTGEGSAPSDAEKWLLLQSVIGTWPMSDEEREGFEGRIAEYVPKALREAKVHSHWTEINEPWEQATMEWITGVIRDSRFQSEITEMQKGVAFFGMINSLATIILKITSPGIPDIYQGSEMWNLSLVDPDNRRPVDFSRRREVLSGIEASSGDDSRRDHLLEDLRKDWIDGRIKLFTTWRSLAARRSDAELFMSGDYIPLEVQGSHASHAIAFARRSGDRWSVTVVPRLSLTLCDGDPRYPLGGEIWNDTAVVLPENAPGRWTSWMSGGTVESQDGKILVSRALSHFPAALLTSADQR